MSCHIRLVTENAKLGLPELQLGIIPGFGGTQRLPRYVGVHKACEMMLTSDPISGSEAVELGLANAAFEESQLINETFYLLEKLPKSPISVKATLQLLQHVKQMLITAASKRSTIFGSVFKSRDAQEGVAALLKSASPNF